MRPGSLSNEKKYEQTKGEEEGKRRKKTTNMTKEGRGGDKHNQLTYLACSFSSVSVSLLWLNKSFLVVVFFSFTSSFLSFRSFPLTGTTKRSHTTKSTNQ
jgi:hypothetical protein